MEIYLIILIILGILAISDLIVGVANDAVNFLNSAIGSKVAPRHIILIVASLGVFVGAAFSTGMMEIARKGVFNPSMFYFEELMYLFLAVMLTDIILLDWFNTYGLPTSTTVSIIFELIGATFGVSLYKILSGQTDQNLLAFFNLQKIVEMVSGIFLSIGVAFSFGALFQFIARTFFTFDLSKTYRRYAAFWGALASTGIIAFILLKGGKGSIFINEETANYIKNNFSLLVAAVFASFFVIFQILILAKNVNIFKFVVLFGTFALALAFAGNDLVNFIGVPIAGYNSFEIARKSSDVANLTMGDLASKVTTPPFFLILAGVVMALTLWLSKKAQTVTKTEVNLSRQYEGYERFESSLVARIIVRMFHSFFVNIKKLLPQSVINFFNRRFDVTKQKLMQAPDGGYPSFDLVRALVNLAVSSSIISFATSYKLPLSTTYVTFMVAMGTSFADRAWGRESAVYRVNGVITVIGGWFLTALFAFTLSTIISLILIYGKVYAMTILIVIVLFVIFKSALVHKQLSEEISAEEKLDDLLKSGNIKAFFAQFFNDVNVFLSNVGNAVEQVCDGLVKNNRNQLFDLKAKVKDINKEGNKIITRALKLVRYLDETTIKKGKRFGKLVAAIKEISLNLKSFHQRSLEHLDNNHEEPKGEQAKNLIEFAQLLKNNMYLISDMIKNNDFSKYEEYEKNYQALKSYILKVDEEEIIRIKNGESPANSSSLFFNLVFDGENIADHANSIAQNFRKNFSQILYQ